MPSIFPHHLILSFCLYNALAIDVLIVVVYDKAMGIVWMKWVQFPLSSQIILDVTKTPSSLSLIETKIDNCINFLRLAD